MTRSVLRFFIRPGGRAELVQAFGRLRILEAASGHDGFINAELQISHDDPDEVLVTATWSSADAYQQWLDNPIRAKFQAELEPLLVEPPEPRIYEIVREVHI